jgi:hypothetical protein
MGGTNGKGWGGVEEMGKEKNQLGNSSPRAYPGAKFFSGSVHVRRRRLCSELPETCVFTAKKSTSYTNTANDPGKFFA